VTQLVDVTEGGLLQREQHESEDH